MPVSTTAMTCGSVLGKSNGFETSYPTRRSSWRCSSGTARICPTCLTAISPLSSGMPKQARSSRQETHSASNPWCSGLKASASSSHPSSKQILALPYVPVAPDDLAVGEVLVNRYVDSGRTFYTDVRLVRPGHSLMAGKDGWREARHWSPDPGKVASFARPDECFELFRSHLKDAVKRRLQIDHPAVAELSGGFDSSSVVVLAGSAKSEGVVSCPRIETLSALYPGLTCDESEYSEAVSAVVPFPRRTYVALGAERCIGAAEELRRVDAPYLLPPHGESLALEQNLREVEAKVLLTGTGGDESTRDNAILSDLADSFQYKHLVRILWSIRCRRGKRTSEFPLTLLRAGMPSGLRGRFRRLRPRPPWTAPSWLEPRFARRLEEYLRSPTQGDRRFPSWLQQSVYDGVSGPRSHRTFEVGERRRSYMAVEQRHPFLDRAYVEYVLSIRHGDRIPDSGAPKYLLRRALRHDLPAKVRDRGHKTDFTTASKQGVRRLSQRLMSSGAWASEAFVPQHVAHELLNSPSAVIAEWWPNRMVGLECWLRSLG